MCIRDSRSVRGRGSDRLCAFEQRNSLRDLRLQSGTDIQLRGQGRLSYLGRPGRAFLRNASLAHTHGIRFRRLVSGRGVYAGLRYRLSGKGLRQAVCKMDEGRRAEQFDACAFFGLRIVYGRTGNNDRGASRLRGGADAFNEETQRIKFWG